MTPLLASIGSVTLGIVMFCLSVFLILLVLVQRGKGGGLTGALGGPGGQSAFGSKAGDTFTLITAVSAIIWGLVCAIAMYTLGVPPTTASDDPFESEEDVPGLVAPAGEDAGGLSGLEGILSDDLDLDLGSMVEEAGSEADSGSESEGEPGEAAADDSSEGESGSGVDSAEEEDSVEEVQATPSVELTPPSNE